MFVQMRLYVAWAALAVMTPALGADDGAKSIDLGQIAAVVMGSGGAPGAKPESNLPEFGEVTKGMKSDEGLFTLWYHPADAKDKDPEKLLCQIPAAFLGEKFMLSTSISGGGFLTGFPWEERVVKWELLGDQLLLVAPETHFIAQDDQPVSDVVRRTYPDRIRAAVPVVTKSPSGDPVIDLGPWLKSNFAGVSEIVGGGPFGMMGGMSAINSELSKWNKKKVFKYNVELGVELAVSSPFPPGSFNKSLVHYSFWKLPESDYRPRIADERVGYFLTANQDWAKPNEARDIFNRYINRWHLEKRDPELALCEPKQPITFYIEKTVPIRFRRAVRDGILEWNKAFEKVGFSNAVEVRQQDDNDPETRHLDPEDMRYSFFRWIVTGAGFAMGPSRANPFTGQIYDADIIFDDSMVRFFEQEAQRSLSSRTLAPWRNDPALEAFLERFPEWRRPEQPWESVDLGQSVQPKVRSAFRKVMRERGCQLCDYSHGMKHQMAMAEAVLAGAPKDVIDRLLYDVIKEVVMHEVGHTLGLRHNFQASTIYSVDEIKKRRLTNESTTGSVMDYNPVLFFADAGHDGRFITPTLGPYDHWAIEYGYRPFDASFAGETESTSPGASEKKDKEKTEPKKGDAAKTITTSAPTDLSKIPKEVLDQLPPEVKAMMASGQAAAVMATNGSPDPGPAIKSAGSAHKAPPSGEEAMLRDIAGRSTRPELAYSSDEDATFVSPDPRVNRFDMGSDPIDWAKSRAELVDKRMNNILEWAVKDQESWYYLRQSFLSLLFEKAYVLDYVGRYVGGQYFQRTVRGADGSPAPFTLVEPAKQRAALAFIEENLFNDKFFAIPPEVLNHLAPPRWWHDGMNVSFTVDFPIHAVIAMIQGDQMFSRLFPNTLRRIHDAELKSTATDKLTAAEYLQRLQKACWGQTAGAQAVGAKSWTDAAPFLSSAQRSLQREYLNVMELLVRQSPGTLLSPDLHAMVQHSLRQLSADLDTAIKVGKADFASQAHLASCRTRIERMLAPELNEFRGRSMMAVEE